MTVPAKEARDRVAALARFHPTDIWLSQTGWAIATDDATVIYGELGPDAFAVPFAQVKAFIGKGDDPIVVANDPMLPGLVQAGLVQGSRLMTLMAHQTVSSGGETPPDTPPSSPYAVNVDAAVLRDACGVAAFAGKPTMRHRPAAYTRVVRFTGTEAWATDEHRMAWATCEGVTGVYAAPAVAALGKMVPRKGTVAVGDGVFAWPGHVVALRSVRVGELDFRAKLADVHLRIVMPPDLGSVIAPMPSPIRVAPKAGKVLVITAEGTTATVRADYEGDGAEFGVNPAYVVAMLKWCKATEVAVGARAMWWEGEGRGATVALVGLKDD